MVSCKKQELLTLRELLGSLQICLVAVRVVHRFMFSLLLFCIVCLRSYLTLHGKTKDSAISIPPKQIKVVTVSSNDIHVRGGFNWWSTIIHFYIMG